MSKYLDSCKTEFWKNVFRAELDYLVKELEGYKKILSVGCGPATIEGELAEQGFNVTGLDISREALKCAPDSIRKAVGSAEHMDMFEDSSFDAAIYIASLQFIKNYEKAVEETARVLKPKGKFLAMMLNPGSEFFKGKRKEQDSYVNKIMHADLNEMEYAISKYFTVEKKEYYLGIRGNEIFKSHDPKTASLYVVTGIKK